MGDIAKKAFRALRPTGRRALCVGRLPRGVDWTELYREHDYDRIAYLAGDRMSAFLERFIERVGVPGTVLSVGCGPAVAEFALAERHPEVELLGVDLAPAVIEDNRAEADRRGLGNVAFAVDALPALAVEGEFDVVYCVATLFFVSEVEAALEALWGRVAPGGHLVVTYADEATREWARSTPEETRAFFGPVLDGSALRSRDAVEAAIGRPVEDYWAAVGAAGDEYTERAPTVYARKPADRA